MSKAKSSSTPNQQDRIQGLQRQTYKFLQQQAGAIESWLLMYATATRVASSLRNLLPRLRLLITKLESEDNQSKENIISSNNILPSESVTSSNFARTGVLSRLPRHISSLSARGFDEVCVVLSSLRTYVATMEDYAEEIRRLYTQAEDNCREDVMFTESLCLPPVHSTLPDEEPAIVLSVADCIALMSNSARHITISTGLCNALVTAAVQEVTLNGPTSESANIVMKSEPKHIVFKPQHTHNQSVAAIDALSDGWYCDTDVLRNILDIVYGTRRK